MKKQKTRSDVCKSCKYYLNFYDNSQGECHRFPPASDDEGNPNFQFVNYYDWCGEFKKG